MARLLQFLGGEAKEAVTGFEAIGGRIQQALQILEERYGRPCMIMNSLISNLIKGPAIPNGDKVSLRRFADQTALALVMLRAMDCLSDINQGNVMGMVERLPRHLPDNFTHLSHDLEEKSQRFPTFADFVKFVNKP